MLQQSVDRDRMCPRVNAAMIFQEIRVVDLGIGTGIPTSSELQAFALEY